MTRSSLVRGAAANLAAFLVVAVVGCSVEKATPADGKAARPSTLPATFLLASEPAGARSIKDLVATAKDGDEVVASGRVGETGSDTAFFRFVDASIKACSEMSMDDKCPTPWDYCCEPAEAMAKASATVEFREGDHPYAGSLLGFHGLDHLTNVVVRGKAEKDSSGNVTIVASGIFIRS